MLTNIVIQKALPREKDYKLSDSAGLYLFVSKTGHKSFRFKYRFGGKERRQTFGSYPEMSLAEARDRRDDARKLLRDHQDPGLERKRQKLVADMSNDRSFEAFARDWHKQQSPRWVPVHAADVIGSLERDAFSHIGGFDVTNISEQMIVATLEKVQKRGAIETAHRLRQRISAVLRYAKASGAGNTNAAADLNMLLKPVPKAKLRPALVDLAELHKLIATVDATRSHPLTRLASRFLSLVAQRPAMVRKMTWDEIEGVDWDKEASGPADAVWRVPAGKMKQEFKLREDDDFEHVVPLVAQAVDTLRAVRRLSGSSQYVFPGGWSSATPISENAIGYLYNREGYQNIHVPHGWRSSFSTIMNELLSPKDQQHHKLNHDRLVIDLMLAHKPSGMSDAEFRYNRAAYQSRRREIAQQWADLLLDGACDPNDFLDGPRRRAYRAKSV